MSVLIIYAQLEVPEETSMAHLSVNAQTDSVVQTVGKISISAKC